MSATRVNERAARGTDVLMAAAALAGTYLLVFGPAVLTSVRVVAGRAAPLASSAWADRIAALEWDVFAVAVVVVVVLRWLPGHAPAVAARMQLTRPPAARLAAATAAYVAVAAGAAWLGGVAVSAAHLPTAHYTGLAGGVGGFVTAAGAATAAGITEEITLVALAAAVVEQLCRRHPARRVLPATLALLVALRLLVHLYYLWGSAFALLWVPGAYLVYRWAGSIWPLVAGHWIYDWLALTAASFPRTARVVDAAVWLVGGCGVAAVLTTWRRAVRPSSCSVPSSASRRARRATSSGRATSRSTAHGSASARRARPRRPRPDRSTSTQPLRTGRR
jgi:hypothetical protein